MAQETSKLATIRQNVFANLFTLINTNKPSDFTFAGKTITWKILSAFPEDNADFPCIIINSALVKPEILGFTGSCFVIEDIEIEIEFYSLAKYGKERIDIGRDNVQDTLFSNTSTLSDNNLLLNADPFDDSNVDSFISGKEKINTGASIVKMSLK